MVSLFLLLVVSIRWFFVLDRVISVVLWMWVCMFFLVRLVSCSDEMNVSIIGAIGILW